MKTSAMVSLEELLDRMVAVERVPGHDGRSGARLERGVLADGRRVVIKWSDPRADLTARIDKGAEGRELRLLSELDTITSAIPSDQLAIQWDVAVEIGVLEGLFPTGFPDVEALIFGWLITFGNVVRPAVGLGYHLCYGMYQRRHMLEPRDTTLLTNVANRTSAAVQRAIQYFHMPVPPARSDDAYFAPLTELRLHPETELYLGLVHGSDGEDGTRKRMRAAEHVVKKFGIASECGLGWEAPESLIPLFRLYAACASAPVDGATRQ